jgi:hypothetical protein
MEHIKHIKHIKHIIYTLYMLNSYRYNTAVLILPSITDCIISHIFFNLYILMTKKDENN